MSQNIFTSENIMKYRKNSSTTAGVGEWVDRNNDPAMRIIPLPFYISSSEGYCHILENEFLPNTQYLFDIWLDSDDTINNGTYYNGGFKILYSNGTTQNVYATHTNGWKHFHIITPDNVSVSYIYVLYSYNKYVYYRWDSCICPISTASLTKQGVLNTTHCLENVTTANIDNGGLIRSSQIIEY